MIFIPFLKFHEPDFTDYYSKQCENPPLLINAFFWKFWKETRLPDIKESTYPCLITTSDNI